MPPTISKNSNDSRRVLVILALLLFIVALILVIVSSIMPGTKKIGSFGGSYAEGYKAAREQSYLTGMPKMPVHSLSGAILSLSNSSMKIKTNLFVDQRVDGVGQERTINVDRSTKIQMQVQKDLVQFNKDMDAYLEKAKNQEAGQEPIAPPQPIELKIVKLSDLKPGDIVTVTVDGDKDLTLEDSVKATLIQVLPVTAPLAGSQSEMKK